MLKHKLLFLNAMLLILHILDCLYFDYIRFTNSIVETSMDAFSLLMPFWAQPALPQTLAISMAGTHEVGTQAIGAFYHDFNSIYLMLMIFN